ncbi:hypothetical protein K5549_022015 [Capra hircus]|nr:hypothetical protein K5549_022015 [Capra hircus]
MNVPQRPERTADLLDTELQMSGEVYLASKNLLIDAKGVVIKKWRKPVRKIKMSIFSGQCVWGAGGEHPQAL